MSTTQTFPHWLRDQTERGDDVAAFATAALALDDLPDSGGKPIYDGYFTNTLAEQHGAYERAFAEFEASPEPAAS